MRSDDGIACIWDAATGKRLAELRGHVGPVRDVNYGPDGKYIITASDDCTSHIYACTLCISLEELFAAAHERAVRDLTNEEREEYLRY